MMQWESIKQPPFPAVSGSLDCIFVLNGKWFWILWWISLISNYKALFIAQQLIGSYLFHYLYFTWNMSMIKLRYIVIHYSNSVKAEWPPTQGPVEINFICLARVTSTTITEDDQLNSQLCLRLKTWKDKMSRQQQRRNRRRMLRLRRQQRSRKLAARRLPRQMRAGF